MAAEPLDFRSDTVTQPTPGMRKAMAAAAVGDDVFGEDPSILALQAKTAELLGKEAAIFVPSGTMSNLIGVMLHGGRGDEFLCEAGCHIFNYEQSGYAQIGGLAARPIEGDAGVLTLADVQGMIRPSNDHLVRTRMICLENTHNRGGGRIQPYSDVEAICAWAHDHGLATHLDGARLWNAAAATGIALADWARHFDTVSVCFSKGLGAPVGSALAGPSEAIARARRIRKVLGGGTRQGGVIAAGALYALEHHRDRLVEDHLKAATLGEAIARTPGLKLATPSVDTNIVIFRVATELGTAADFCARLREQGVLALAVGPQDVRMVTHLDVSQQDAEAAAAAIEAAAEVVPVR